MKYLMALILIASPAFANIVDSTYTVTPPVAGAQCPAIQAGMDPAFNCYYTAIGEFTDTYQFEVPTDATYSFEVTGTHWRRCTTSGHRTCYVESMTINWAAVVDSTGATVLELTNVAVDDWAGTVQLPPGSYSLLINGTVGGNRPGVYGYDIHDPPTPIIVD